MGYCLWPVIGWLRAERGGGKIEFGGRECSIFRRQTIFAVLNSLYYVQLPESLEQSLSSSSSARPTSPTKGLTGTNLALGTTEKDKPKEKEKSKEIREREKVEKRLTEVRRGTVVFR